MFIKNSLFNYLMMKIFEKIRVGILIMILVPIGSFSQMQHVINWSCPNTMVIEGGLAINTSIPISANINNLVSINGYNFDEASTIAFSIAWQGEGFKNPTASSSGGYAPPVSLGVSQDGTVIIYLRTGFVADINLQISFAALGGTMDGDWLKNWTVSVGEGWNDTPVIYANNFNGDTKVQGLLTANSAAITDAYIGNMTVAKVKGVLPVEDPVNEGEVTLVPGDGGINIISGNDNHSYIDFRGLDHLNSVQGRILHSDNLGFRIFTNGVTKTLSNNTVVPNPPAMVINNNGVVGIGNTTDLASTSTTPYKLFVAGGIRTRKLKVDAAATLWPDYVFEPTYGLRSLASLEAFIKANKHLPDVPSADDVNKDGVDVGDVQAALLKKVEELTLYVIEQGKEIKMLQKIIAGK